MPLTNTLIFDIETVADTEGYRRLYPQLAGLSDEEIYQTMLSERLGESGTSFMRAHLHKVAAISVLYVSRKGLRVSTRSLADMDESGVVGGFFEAINRVSPTLVSWNGAGFDLPVLQYRALIHGLNARQYFEIGDSDYARNFRYNNYLSRYHWRHIDMMDVLSGFLPQHRASLHDIALLCGIPGKLGIDGAQVQSYYARGEIEAIANYCETDVMSTYLVYLRFELMRGKLDSQMYEAHLQQVHDYLSAQPAQHWQTYLSAWEALA